MNTAEVTVRHDPFAFLSQTGTCRGMKTEARAERRVLRRSWGHRARQLSCQRPRWPEMRVKDFFFFFSVWGEGFAQPSKIKVTDETMTAMTLWKLESGPPGGN